MEGEVEAGALVGWLYDLYGRSAGQNLAPPAPTYMSCMRAGKDSSCPRLPVYSNESYYYS